MPIALVFNNNRVERLMAAKNRSWGRPFIWVRPVSLADGIVQRG